VCIFVRRFLVGRYARAMDITTPAASSYFGERYYGVLGERPAFGGRNEY
jgi:hypothetical protein